MLRKGWIVGGLAVVMVLALFIGRTPVADAAPAGPLTSEEYAARADVMNGRRLVITHDCAGCHGGTPDVANENWLVGRKDSTLDFQIGPFKTYPRNLTPDNLTGIGRFTERQIFNALRFGLRPGETPDATITSMTPGEGNFPANPKYLAPPMPWPAWRHMTDQELWDIAAYLKRAVRPVSNKVPDSEGPPDFWASAYTVEQIGAWPAPAFPTAQERQPN